MEGGRRAIESRARNMFGGARVGASRDANHYSKPSVNILGRWNQAEELEVQVLETSVRVLG
jgi:hypothetical protein